jgi:hypothetical protein
VDRRPEPAPRQGTGAQQPSCSSRGCAAAGGSAAAARRWRRGRGGAGAAAVRGRDLRRRVQQQVGHTALAAQRPLASGPAGQRCSTAADLLRFQGPGGGRNLPGHLRQPRALQSRAGSQPAHSCLLPPPWHLLQVPALQLRHPQAPAQGAALRGHLRPWQRRQQLRRVLPHQPPPLGQRCAAGAGSCLTLNCAGLCLPGSCRRSALQTVCMSLSLSTAQRRMPTTCCRPGAIRHQLYGCRHSVGVRRPGGTGRAAQ